MSVSGREAIPEARECSEDPQSYPGVIRKVLPDVRNWSGVPPGCSGVVGSPSGMSEIGRDALGDVREALGDERE